MRQPTTFTLRNYKLLLALYLPKLTIEYGGNGRYGFYPATGGNQWRGGAVELLHDGLA